MLAIDATGLELLLNQIPTPISIFELICREQMDFRYVYVNDAGVEFSGLDRNFWIGKNTRTYSAAIYDGVAAIPNAMMKALDTKKAVTIDSAVYVDDTMGPIVSAFTLVYVEENKIAMVTKSAVNDESITHELSIQKQMLEMGERTTRSCSWILNEHTEETIFTPSYLKVHHFDKGEINSQDAYAKTIARIHPLDREQVVHFHKAPHNHYPVAKPFRYLVSDDRYIWLKDTISQRRPDGNLIGTTQDITESREREMQLEQALHFQQKIMDTSPEIIYIYDLEKRQNVFSNKTIFAELGYSRADMDNMGSNTLATIVHPDDLPNVFHYENEVVPKLQKDEVVKIDYRLYSKKTNSYIHFESLESIFEQDEQGKNLSVIGVGRNVQAERMAEAEVLRKNKELEQFAYVASHDLQEPLRTITSFTGLLAKRYEGKFDEAADTYLKYITQASTHMSTLVRELLEYSRIGRSSELEKVDTNLVLQNVIDDLNSKIKETEATFETQKLPVVRGYEMELRLLFQNLLSNALKFHKPGVAPHVKVSAEKESASWKFAFQDNGIGIAEQYQEKIFVIFQRLHNKRDYSGTGIGLAHCQKIVELHGGKIWLDSQLDKGTTFYVRLPS